MNDFAELGALGREKVEGKIVLFNNKFNREMAASGFGGQAYGQAVAYRFAGAMAAARLGAVAVLVRSAGGSQNRLAHTGTLGYADGVPRIPGGAIPFEDAETIAHLTQEGRVRVKLVLTPETLPDAPSFNVIGDLLYGIILTNLLTGRPADPDTQTDEVLDIMFHGILTDAERKRSLKRTKR